jgi:hypothetical protein
LPGSPRQVKIANKEREEFKTSYPQMSQIYAEKVGILHR